MGKIILNEYSFNKVNGMSSDTNELAYSKITSCLSVTCICDDGTIGGGHIAMIPFGFWYVISNLAKILSGKNITKVCVIGSDAWANPNNLNNIFNSTDPSLYFPAKRGGDPDKEKQYLAKMVTIEGKKGIEAVLKQLLGNNNLSFYTQLYEGEMDVDFVGGKSKVTLRYPANKMYLFRIHLIRINQLTQIQKT